MDTSWNILSSNKKTMNSLYIELIEKIDYDDFDRMWVRLTYETESSEICLEPTLDFSWAYLEGDNEPNMPDEIRKIWESKAGDDILTALWNGDFDLTCYEINA